MNERAERIADIERREREEKEIERREREKEIIAQELSIIHCPAMESYLNECEQSFRRP